MDVKHGLPCIKCDSSDAMSVYEDGSGYCFSCKQRFFPDEIENNQVGGKVYKSTTSQSDKVFGVPIKQAVRGITPETLEYFGVLGEYSQQSGEVVSLIFPVFVEGNKSGEKVKLLEQKGYRAEGITKNPDFFGANTVGEGGKLLIITEGELDAMSAHQMLRQQGKAYNVVSLPNGANASSVRKHLEWVETFETVILNLDNDKIGQEAAIQIANLLTPGKVKIMHLPTKDANEFLTSKHTSKEYLAAVYHAKPYRPDGIVALSDSWELMWADADQVSVPYPWEGLNNMLYGQRKREIVTWAAGTGTGKSAIMRELEHHLFKTTTDNIGILPLEESVSRTAWGIVGIEANRPLAIREERGCLSVEEIKTHWDNTLGSGRIFTLDHFGSTSEENLISRVRYLVKGLNCEWIILDHLSIVVSAMNEGGDERRTIDSIMTKLRQLVEETNVGMHLVSHLRRSSGDRGHEQGVEVSLSHLRGSQAIAQLSDVVVAAERDQQAVSEKEANLTRLRVLKNRYAGITGIATHLAYDRDTGRLSEVTNVQEYLTDDLEM